MIVEFIENGHLDGTRPLTEDLWQKLRNRGWEQRFNPWTREFEPQAVCSIVTDDRDKAESWARFEFEWVTDLNSDLSDCGYISVFEFYPRYEGYTEMWYRSPDKYWQEWMEENAKRYEEGKQLTSDKESVREAVKKYVETQSTKRYTLDEIREKLSTLTETQLRYLLSWWHYDNAMRVVGNLNTPEANFEFNQQIDFLVTSAIRQTAKYQP